MSDEAIGQDETDKASGPVGLSNVGPARFVWLAALSGALLLGGCGFKLRGSTEIPAELSPVFIAGGGGTAVGRAVIERLQGNAVALTDDPKEAGVTLRIRNEGRSSRVVAVDSNGKVLAYELGYRVTFDAVTAKGVPLVVAQTITLDRTLDNPDIEVLGKQEETELIFQDMQREAAELLLLRLRAALH